MTFQLDESLHLSQPSENWAASFAVVRARLVVELRLAAHQVEHIRGRYLH
jgi:hypothetical protein